MTERRNTTLAADRAPNRLAHADRALERKVELFRKRRHACRSTNQDRSLAEGLQPSPLGRPATAASETSI